MKVPMMFNTVTPETWPCDRCNKQVEIIGTFEKEVDFDRGSSDVEFDICLPCLQECVARLQLEWSKR